MDLLLAALPGEGLPALADSLAAAYGIEAQALEVDLAEAAGLGLLIEEAGRLVRAPVLLVNNAGRGENGAFDTMPVEAHRGTVALNIEATVTLTHALIPILARAAPARIITVASLAAFQPMPLFSIYAASKAFLKSWGLALAEELAPLGITSTVLAPGGIYTNEEVRRKVEAQGLVGRWSTQEPSEVALAALRGAERGRTLVIPGPFNRLVALLSSLAPDALKARAVHARWKWALARTAGPGFAGNRAK
jgi:short-subunit dehydrogenase